jgi:ankyrin repeat protein
LPTDSLRAASQGETSSDPQDPELVAALVDSAATGSIDTVRMLVVDKGTNVNASDYDRRSPLHLAAAEGQTDVRLMCRLACGRVLVLVGY